MSLFPGPTQRRIPAPRLPRLAALLVAAFTAIGSVAAAAPRISIADIDFGTISPGASAGRVLSICNEGDDTLTFANPNGGSVITWSVPEFRIAARSLEQLGVTRLGPGECTTITIAFLSESAGMFQTTAHVWSNAAGGRDSSRWTARVAAHRLVIDNLDIGRSRLAAASPCAGGDGGATGSVRIANLGSAAAVVASVRIASGEGVWVIDSGTTIRPGDLLAPASETDTNWRTIQVRFLPQAEEEYAGSAAVTTEDGVTVTAGLSGVGIESHISADDSLSLPPAAFGGGSSSATAVIRATGEYPTTITALTTESGAEFVVISPSATDLPKLLQPGDVLPVVVEFRPALPGTREGRLVVSGDISRCDDTVIALQGVGTGEAGVVDEPAHAARLDLQLRPNPARDQVAIVLDAAVTTWSRAELFDLLGQLVTSVERSESPDECALDLGGVAPGEYVVRVNSAHGVAARRLHVVR